MSGLPDRGLPELTRVCPVSYRPGGFPVVYLARAPSGGRIDARCRARRTTWMRDAFLEVFTSAPNFRRMVLRYTEALFNFMGQSMALSGFRLKSAPFEDYSKGGTI